MNTKEPKTQLLFGEVLQGALSGAPASFAIKTVLSVFVVRLAAN